LQVPIEPKGSHLLSGDKVTLEIIQGADHGTLEFNTKENIEKVIAFLDKYLK